MLIPSIGRISFTAIIDGQPKEIIAKYNIMRSFTDHIGRRWFYIDHPEIFCRMRLAHGKIIHD